MDAIYRRIIQHPRGGTPLPEPVSYNEKNTHGRTIGGRITGWRGHSKKYGVFITGSDAINSASGLWSPNDTPQIMPSGGGPCGVSCEVAVTYLVTRVYPPLIYLFLPEHRVRLRRVLIPHVAALLPFTFLTHGRCSLCGQFLLSNPFSIATLSILPNFSLLWDKWELLFFPDYATWQISSSLLLR